MIPNPKIKRQKDKAYLEYIKSQRCLICSAECNGDIVAHHTTTKGAGGSDYLTVSLCKYHHYLVHLIGRYRFQNTLGISFKTEIIRLLKAYHKQNKEIKELLKELEGK